MMTEDGCWADYRTDRSMTEGRPALFLDRDGVLIEDTGYPHDPAAVILVPETLDLVRLANQLGFVVGIVTNQSGIGRGYFDWAAFASVQAVIDTALAARGAQLDFVLACPHLPQAPIARYSHPAHPWRKPAPGMLLAAAEQLALNVPASALLGDKPSDVAAAAAAGVRLQALLAMGKSECEELDALKLTRDILPQWLTQAGGDGCEESFGWLRTK